MAKKKAKTKAKRGKKKAESSEDDVKDMSPISSVAAMVRDAEDRYTTGETNLSKYVSLSMFETISRVEAYANSKHITPPRDSQGRPKPFFNIVTAAENVWFRATDIDRSNIKIKPTKVRDVVASYLATVKVQDWMRRAKFAKFLNKWGRGLARYGSYVVKFVREDGMIKPITVPWGRLIVDDVDFESNPVIEVLELTPAQLRKKEKYDPEMVEALIAAQEVRETLDGQQRDTKAEFIKVYEVHGELPMSWLTGQAYDEDRYRQQMQVISFVADKEREGEFKDFVLYAGRERKDPYMLTHLLEEEDRTLSIGSVQNLFDSQWMVNHSEKTSKDFIDLASKIIYQTADGRFVGQNVLSAIEQGDILVHADNKPLTLVGGRIGDISAMQSFSERWKGLGREINGISEAMMGATPKSGTAWRQTAATLQESHSLFEVMTENKGNHLDDMFREWIIPDIKARELDNADEIAATLESHGIEQIDRMFIPNFAKRRYNYRAKEATLSGEIPEPFNQEKEEASIRAEMSQLGNQRFFKPSEIPDKTWKEALKDIEWELEIDITGEQKNVQQVMETLNTALGFVAKATPQQLADPNFRLVFNKILEETSVISAAEIASVPQPEPTRQPSKISESMSYKDAPDDIRRQMEERAGMKPSQGKAMPQAVVQRPGVGASSVLNSNQ